MIKERKFGFDLDNTLINYDRAALEWSRSNGLGFISTIEELKNYYNSSGRYSEDWLKVQEWLYTEGLNWALLAKGSLETLEQLQKRSIKFFIVSHKSKLSARRALDLRTPALKWLNTELHDVGINLDRTLFFEENRAKKISRIRREGITDFVDDLVEVFLEPNFPNEVMKFWLTNKASQIGHDSIISIREISEILKHV